MALPLLLTYNLKPDTEARIARICRDLGIRVRTVNPGEYALPIGALAGIPIAKAPTPDAMPGHRFNDEMLVMCHMMSNELDAFLNSMRAANVPRIALKAVLTPINVAWNSLDLHRELAREHSEMQRRDR